MLGIAELVLWIGAVIFYFDGKWELGTMFVILMFLALI